MSAIVLAVTAACGAAGGAAATGRNDGDDGGGLLGPQVNVAINLTGATALSGEQTAAAPTINGTPLKSCAEYAKGSTSDGETRYPVVGLLDGPVAGKTVTLELLVDGYTGPGTYPKDQLVAPGSRPSIAVDGTVYSTWPDSTSSEVVIDGKGGGAWTFSKLASTGPGGLPGDAVTGTVQWTCRGS